MISALVPDCAAWSLSAYDRPPAGNPYVQLLHDAQGLRGFVFETVLSVVIAVRGTASVRDAVTDLNVEKVPFDDSPELRVHAGVHREFEAVWPEVRPFIQKDKELIVTGHSLGGGIATLLAWKAARARLALPEVVTFGSLRVMTPEAALVYDREVPETTRLVHAFDIVPRVPKLGYAHVGRLLHLSDRGRVIGDWPVGGCLERFFWHLKVDGKTIEKDFDAQAEADHHMTMYVQCANRWYHRTLKKELQHREGCRETERTRRQVPDQAPE